MLKNSKTLKSGFEADVEPLLQRVLSEVPGVALKTVVSHSAADERWPELVCTIDVMGHRHDLLCQLRSNGQPRQIRDAIFNLRRQVGQRGGIPVVMAPFLTESSRALCRESGVGYVDGYLNAHIASSGFLLSRTMEGKPATERRDLRSLFRPRSAAVLRIMLRDPTLPWRVAELARTAKTSLGHVSNVRNALLERGWAELGDGGVRLSDPDALLDAWRAEYAPPPADRRCFYTTKHGSALTGALRSASDFLRGSAVLSSFSAADWVAPFARTGTSFFYADEEGLAHLADALELSPTTRGENVTVAVVEDLTVLSDWIEPAPGVFCTSPVQTYLDLYAAGERGREAADHLRREILQWVR